MSLFLIEEERIAFIKEAAEQSLDSVRVLRSKMGAISDELSEQQGIYTTFQAAYGALLTRFEVLNAQVAKLLSEQERAAREASNRSKAKGKRKPARRKRAGRS